MNGLFPLGRIRSTPGAKDALEETGDTPRKFLARHISGDWEEMSAYDREANKRALLEGSRIFSAYHLSDGTKIWIITEADRSMTTILRPSEY